MGRPPLPVGTFGTEAGPSQDKPLVVCVRAHGGTRLAMPRYFLYHFHGLGSIDFSEMTPDDLPALDALAAERELEVLPTVYLRREHLPEFTALVETYNAYREQHPGTRVRGFAVEGPMLGPEGGIPRAGVWTPTVDEWRRLADLGPRGLRYIVMAPDAMELEDEIGPGFTFADLVTGFYDGGCRLALGHFHRDDPDRSAKRMERLVWFLHERYESSPYLVLTDHLFNDMPRNFRHAYRTADEQAVRKSELAQFLATPWTRENLPELVGPVPAAMLAMAADGRLFPCLNFDGYHVDLAVAERTVDYLGAGKLIVLTDHTEVATMAREELTDDGSYLWRRDDGKVAAGMSGPERQRENMTSIGLSDGDIDRMFWTNPKNAVEYVVAARESGA